MIDRTSSPPAERGIGVFLLVYALAWAGGAIAYTPFLTLLLPERVIDSVGPDLAVGWLSTLAFCGAIAASIANIGFGMLSDRTRNRRGWAAAGLAISSVLLPLFNEVEGLWPQVALIVAWQCALNMMLGPLGALAGDVVPDARKGTLGGLLSLAPALGAASGALVTWPGIVGTDARPLVVAMLVVVCVVPVLLLPLPPRVDQARTDAEPADPPTERMARHTVARMWLARLSLQVAEAALFAFLYLWFRTIDPALGANRTAIVFGAVLAVSAPIALAVGRWADRSGKPMTPLTAAATISAVGLCLMALAQGTQAAILAYALFGVASTVFLALHSAQTLRILPRARNRGRDLGLFNLTNTTPSLVMPTLALSLVPQFGFSGLFLALASLALLSAVLVPRNVA